jgi:hypothetical protein
MVWCTLQLPSSEWMGWEEVAWYIGLTVTVLLEPFSTPPPLLPLQDTYISPLPPSVLFTLIMVTASYTAMAQQFQSPKQLTHKSQCLIRPWKPKDGKLPKKYLHFTLPLLSWFSKGCGFANWSSRKSLHDLLPPFLVICPTHNHHISYWHRERRIGNYLNSLGISL